MGFPCLHSFLWMNHTLKQLMLLGFGFSVFFSASCPFLSPYQHFICHPVSFRNGRIFSTKALILQTSFYQWKDNTLYVHRVVLKGFVTILVPGVFPLGLNIFLTRFDRALAYSLHHSGYEGFSLIDPMSNL